MESQLVLLLWLEWLWKVNAKVNQISKAYMSEMGHDRQYVNSKQ